MPRDPAAQMREQLAHLAARLMAQDGIADFALAKRKAARQLGVPETRHLPNNDEIEQALRAYRAIYQDEEQRARLTQLRRQALAVMRELAQFDPHLTGPVLSGSAGRYADVELQLFTDSAKDVELFLLNRRIPYQHGERRLYAGSTERSVPVLTLNRDGMDIHLMLLSRTDLRGTLKTSAPGKPLERARAEQVEALLSPADAIRND